MKKYRGVLPTPNIISGDDYPTSEISYGVTQTPQDLLWPFLPPPAFIKLLLMPIMVSTAGVSSTGTISSCDIY